MTLTPLDVVKAIRESNIYISSSEDINQTVKYVMSDFTNRLDSSIDTLKSLPNDNTKSITHLREVQYLVLYEREAVDTALHEHISLLKLHNIL